MSKPTPRFDALRKQREEQYEAEQKRLNAESREEKAQKKKAAQAAKPGRRNALESEETENSPRRRAAKALYDETMKDG
jgi:hypothetical protein